MTYYKVDFQNTGYIDDGILTIEPDKKDRTEIAITKYSDKAGFLGQKIIDVEKFLDAEFVSDADATRSVACVRNSEYQNAVNCISSKIIQESEKGKFGTTYSTQIYEDATLNAIKSHFSRKGYLISWELVRGVGCSERVFTISWF